MTKRTADPENLLPHPPKVAEKLVGLLLSGDDRETILGDFSEEYCRLALAWGRRRPAAKPVGLHRHERCPKS